MLGVTSYQEALRAIGGMLDRERPSADLTSVETAGDAADNEPVEALPELLVLVEDPAQGTLSLVLEGEKRRLSPSQLLDVVLASRALRGATSGGAGPLSDLLRAVGYALDELRAVAVSVEVHADAISIRFSEREVGARKHELTYAGEELEALRQSAANRRKGQPLRRVLILHDGEAASGPIRELLVAEFAVEDLPSFYARAVAQAGESPHMTIVHVGSVRGSAELLEPVRVLRESSHTAHMPILVIAGEGSGVNPMEAFQAGADDVLEEPFAPAQLRARLRTWMLRGGNGHGPGAEKQPAPASPARRAVRRVPAPSTAVEGPSSAG